MSANTLLARQVARVRRRLFVQLCLNRLAVGWAIALVLTTGWLLARPYVAATAEPWVSWAVGGGLFALGTAVAAWLAARRTPTPVDAALSMDERFRLRERVTTSLTLTPEQQATPAGRALLNDVAPHLEKLKVGEKFPVRLTWASALVPAAALALTGVALFYNPVIPQAKAEEAAATPVPPAIANEIEQKKQEFLKRQQQDPRANNRPKPEELREVEAKLEEILKRPTETKEQVRERVAEITPLEEQLRKRERQEAEKLEALQNQFEKLGKKDEDPKNGFSKKFREALANNDVSEAKKEADRLSKKLKESNELPPDEKKQLEQQLDSLKQDLERLDREKQANDEQRRQEKEQKLQEQFKEGKIDKEKLDREMNQLKQERQEKSEAKELAEQLDKAQKALEKGDTKAAGEAMQEVAEQLDKLEQREQNLDDVQNELQRMNDLRDSMCKGCPNGRDGSEDDAETLSRDKEGNCECPNPRGKNGKGKGKRPENKGGDAASIDSKQRGPFIKTGSKVGIGTAEGKSVIGKVGAAVDGEVKQASQDAPEAIEVQRIPKGYKDSAKGYFRNIGGQKTDEKK